METEYSVGTTNRFSFFLDGEDDPGDEIIPSSQPDKSDKNSKKKVDAKTKGKAKEVKEKTQQQAGKKTGGEAPAKRKCGSCRRACRHGWLGHVPHRLACCKPRQVQAASQRRTLRLRQAWCVGNGC